MLKLDDYLDFGKYSGIQLREVIHQEPFYVEWAAEEGIIELDEEASEYLQNVDDHFEVEALTELYHHMNIKED